MSTDHHPWSGILTRRAWVGTTLVGIVVLLGSAGASAATAPTTPPRPDNSFATGTVASLVGSTLEVQSTSGQTTVTVSPTTTFTQIEQEATSAIVVGDCVRATGTGSTTKGIKAVTVSVSSTTSSTCTLGFGGGAGGFEGAAGAGGFGAAPGAGGRGAFRGGLGGANGTRPSFPTNGRRAGSFATASGPVTVVRGPALTVKARVVKTSSTKKASTKKPQFVTKLVKVTVSSAASVTTTSPATSTQLTVGVCVSAVGPASTTGAITATSVTISQPIKGACTAGFGGGGGLGRFGGGSGGAATGA